MEPKSQELENMTVLERFGKKFYDNVHKWIWYHHGSANFCENCGKTQSLSGNRIMFHWSNRSGNYLRDRSDWKQLCAKCHKIKDAAKLNKKAVKYIRSLSHKQTQTNLALKFGVDQSTISRIINNKRW